MNEYWTHGTDFMERIRHEDGESMKEGVAVSTQGQYNTRNFGWQQTQMELRRQQTWKSEGKRMLDSASRHLITLIDLTLRRIIGWRIEYALWDGNGLNSNSRSDWNDVERHWINYNRWISKPLFGPEFLNSLCESAPLLHRDAKCCSDHTTQLRTVESILRTAGMRTNTNDFPS